MIKYYKVDGVYHSKVDTETLEFEMFATKSGRFLYKKSTEDQLFILHCINNNEHNKVEITEEEYITAKEEFKSKI
jgi:hypothetical protein